MFHSSTQKQHWLFKNETEIDALRMSTNEACCDKLMPKALERGCTLLTADQEHCVVQYYFKELLGFCKIFNPPMWAPLPRTALATAAAYYKRFYLSCSVMEYHPKDMFLCCAFLAFKVDEYNLTLDQFVHVLAPHLVKPTTEFILSHELLLLQKLKFHLTIHSPFRPLTGFLLDIKTRAESVPHPEQLAKVADKFLVESLSSDVSFLYPPSQIALAALSYSAKQTHSEIDSYIVRVLLSTESEETYKVVMEMLQRIEDIVLSTRLPEGPEVAPISKMLQKVFASELMPQKSRKRKSEEVGGGDAEGTGKKRKEMVSGGWEHS